MDNVVLRPKGAKKPTKIKKEIVKLREAATDEIPSTSLDSHEIAIDEAASALLKKLKFFQDRLHAKNPVKAKAHHRLIYGLREIKRDATLLKLVIIARDIESFTEESELHKLVEEVREKCQENNVTVIYSLKKSKMARIFKKQKQIGCVGILDCSGAETFFNDLISANSSSICKESGMQLENHNFQESLFA